MQMQQRAEGGIKEVVLGYIGHEDEDLGDEIEPELKGHELNEAFEGKAQRTSVDELPDDVREIFLSEQHRIKTGEVKRSTDFARGKEVN
jgi:hypothetical protein